ncbi:MAG: ribosome maturation factor RimM [Acidimicrobiales bacterium]
MLAVGRVAKSHGLRGEVVVVLTSSETSRVAAGSVLFAGGRELVVVASRPYQARYIVKFEGVDSREQADQLRGVELTAPPLEGAPDDLWVHELVGAEVVEVSGVSRGRVEAVQANPASDLLVLESGALVPLTFVVGWRDPGRVLEIDPPPGLFEL